MNKFQYDAHSVAGGGFYPEKDWYPEKKVAKIYVVEGSAGVYDDYKTFIIGCYDSAEKADTAKQLFLAQVKEYRNRYTQEQREDLDKKCCLILQSDDSNELWPKEEDDYWKWKYDGHTDTNDNVSIEEIPVNEMIYKFN